MIRAACGLQVVLLLQCVAVYYSMVQCLAVCCSMLQCVAVCCSVLQHMRRATCGLQVLSLLQCVAVCCSMLQCVAMCSSVLQKMRRAACGLQVLLLLQHVAVCCSLLRAYTSQVTNSSTWPIQTPGTLCAAQHRCQCSRVSSKHITNASKSHQAAHPHNSPTARSMFSGLPWAYHKRTGISSSRPPT